ncbi:MAG: helix-turn-helix domain-containing protein [Spirochaetaceae bacterium]|jgi:AraC-like DNA-binding protein|nr:helix-turn-helix domain-containing protein [Spirochaetaceae bacterium]
MRIKDVVHVYKLEGGDKLAWHGRYHTHDPGDYEVHLFLEGSGVFLLNRSKFIIQGNRLFLTKPREFHSILPSAVRRPISYYAILFEPDPAAAQDREIVSLIETQDLFAHRNTVIAGRERFLVEELYHLTRDAGRERAAEYLLLSLLYRWYGRPSLESGEIIPDRNIRGDHAERALALMEKSIQEKLDVGVLAGRLNLSEEHFIRLFHKKLGMSPFQYFIRLKIEAASAYLVDTNHTIASVAEHFGFENPFHFSRVFKKCTGLSPYHYRGIFSGVSVEQAKTGDAVL